MDPIFTFLNYISGLVAFIAFLVSFRAEKRLYFKIIKNEMVEQGRIFVTLRFYSKGTSSIKPDDFYNNNPIFVEFPSAINIIGEISVETKPKNVEIHAKYSEAGIIIQPFLLNSSESFDLSFLIDSPHGRIKIPNARIAGIPRIIQVRFMQNANRLLNISLFCVIISFVSLLILSITTHIPSKILLLIFSPFLIMGTIVELGTFICLVYARYRDYNNPPEYINLKKPDSRRLKA